MALHFSHIARYAPSIQSHIHLKSFAQILTIVMKHPLIVGHVGSDGCVIESFNAAGGGGCAAVADGAP